MTDDKNDKLPSDQEHGGLKPQPAEKPERTDAPPPDSKKVEEDPSEQPS